MATSITIFIPDDPDNDSNYPKISNFEVAASYNWLDELTPTIMVPGIPPIWNPPSIIPSVEPDSGLRYVDQNTDRNPVAPLAALIRAVQSSQPDFDFTAIDIITDRRPIRKLYGFVAGDRNSFDLGVTILGNTALFTRIEKQTRDEQPGNAFKEYRQNFETAYLKIPLSAKGSTSHHHVVRYGFGGMTFLVRSAVDAYLPDQVNESQLAEGNEPTGPEELTDFVKAQSLDEPTTSFKSAHTASVSLIPGGCPIPHAATLELSTRSKWALLARKEDLCAKKMPDLWISQTANFIEAYHTYNDPIGFNPRGNRGKRGGMPRSSKADSQPRLTKFTDIKIKPLADGLVAWEAANAETLGKLVVVMKEAIKAAKHLQGTCLVSFDGENRSLKVSRAKEEEVPGLPEKLQKCFLQPAEEDRVTRSESGK